MPDMLEDEHVAGGLAPMGRPAPSVVLDMHTF